jgi:hypothetical protein
MTTEANFPLRQLCLKPSLYGRFSLDHLWPLLGDHRGLFRWLQAPSQVHGVKSERSKFFLLRNKSQESNQIK